MTDITTRRQAYVDALANLDTTRADLDATGINSGPLQGGDAPELTDTQRAALIAHDAAWKAYTAARRECYGV
jgi:hypothetical protein